MSDISHHMSCTPPDCEDLIAMIIVTPPDCKDLIEVNNGIQISEIYIEKTILRSIMAYNHESKNFTACNPQLKGCTKFVLNLT